MLQDVLAKIPRKPYPEDVPSRCLAFLEERGIPMDLVSTLRECAYTGHIEIGPLSFARVAEPAEQNEEEANRPCLENGFLVVGSGLNGDLVALELASGKMAFISHDELWERDYERFDDCVVRTSLSFHDLWEAAASDRSFPRDCRDAEERWPRQGGRD
jgi:hypothetical protein